MASTIKGTDSNDLLLQAGAGKSIKLKNDSKEIDINSIITTSNIPLSGITAYHLLQGNLAVSNSTITQGFNTTLYTGTGASKDVNTSIDMDTQYGNTPEERFGGLVWLKSRSVANDNFIFDTIRGSGKSIKTNTTAMEVTTDYGIGSWSNNGFRLGGSVNMNTNLATYASWNFQTTHRVTGTTNHGQAYTCHYNPFTGFTIVKYEGSGLAGHEIPHHLGRKLEFVVVKNLSVAQNWLVTSNSFIGNNNLYLNTTEALIGNWKQLQFDNYHRTITGSALENASANDFILYGWANSYFDKSNKLIGNYEIGVYQGTGAVGNKVPTRGKPAWIMIKRLDSTGNWVIFDNKRTPDQFLSANTSGAEADFSGNHSLFQENGFTLDADNGWINALGGQYLYMVAYDTNANGGGTYYPLASDTANVQVNNALIPIAQGIDSNGAKNTILSKNETFSGVTYTQGKNYPYYDALGNRGVSVHKPRYLESELVRTYAGESPDYFNVKENKWYSTNNGSELVTNGTFSSGTTTGWTAYSSVISIVNNTLQIIPNASVEGGAYTTITTVVGKKYTLIGSIIQDASSYAKIRAGTIAGADNIATTAAGVNNHIISFIAQSTTTYISVNVGGGNQQNTKVDNISVFETAITPTTEITNGRNYLNHIVYADNDGGVLYVEELPKIEYKDVIKANEYQGKNACTAWVNFDGTTTPPTIRDSYNVSSVVRTATGLFSVYLSTPMDNANYNVIGTTSYEGSGNLSTIMEPRLITARSLSMIPILTYGITGPNPLNPGLVNIQIFGGKN